MLKITGLFAAALLATAPVAFAHSMKHPAPMWRSTQLIGTPVYNTQHQKIGTIAEVLVSPNGHETEAVLAVGGFVGGKKDVAVPLDHLKLAGTTMAMAHATKTDLMAMAPYQIGQSGG